MKKNIQISTILVISQIVFSCVSDKKETPNTNSNDASHIKKVGMVIRLNPDMIDEYKRLHRDDNTGVRDLLTKYNMRNFNIFLHKLDDGNYYEFGYYEYVGDDFDQDMKNLAAEPRNKAWLEICDPMQIPLEGQNGWAEMERIYYNP